MNTNDDDQNGCSSSEIAHELAYLRSLFERRLLDDKTRERAFKELYEQLEFARRGLIEQFLLPIIAEVLITCDRLEREAFENELLYSVVDELLEVFRRRGLQEIEWEGRFEPTCQEIAAVKQVGNPGEDRINIDVARRGYRFGDRIVWPARVVIGRYEVPPSLGSAPYFDSDRESREDSLYRSEPEDD